MKNLFLSLVLVAALGAQGQELPVDVQASKIVWKGSKIIGNSHEGTLEFQGGTLKMKNGKLVGGEFTVDMTSLTNTDLSEGMQEKLVGHLKSDDFFSVEKFPTAKLVLNKVKASSGAYSISADLTIKGKTEPVTLTATVSESDEWMVGEAELTFDRSKFDVRYGSDSFFDNLGDKAISNDIVLKVTVKAQTQGS